MNWIHLRGSRAGRGLLLAGCFVPAVAACRTSTNAPEPTGTNSTTGSATLAPLPDTDIAQAIQRYFQEEALLRPEHVQVAVTQGIAILSGPVSNLLAKQRALHVAETIRGIRAVVDEVTVTPVARTDEQLASDVTHALQRDLSTRTYMIAVAAKNGKVTISGAADSWQQKKLFAEVAEAVPGVKAVDNVVAIHYAVFRPDAEIAADVKSRVANDVWLDGTKLRVTVADATVHLSGVVASVVQKARARSDGWSMGVDRVDDDGIVVDWKARDDQKKVSNYSVKSDPEIAQAVNTVFRVDPRLKTLIPQAVVRNGVAILTGTVDSPQARRSAEADAQDTVGIWSVRDEVVVQPAGAPTDAEIERGVRQALADDLWLPDAKAIQVSCTKGNVVLKGTLSSGIDRLGALADVEGVPGVAEIDDELIVKRPPADIKASIEDRLFWDPMVERERVTVAVAADGVATLTGDLDAWSEIKAATADALAGGATRVVNELTLKNQPQASAR